jgi:hypothetical protein
MQERFPHANLAGSTEVIPTVIHKGDATINRSTNNPDSQLLINVLQAEVPTTQSDRRNPLSCAAESSVYHF